VRSDAPSVPIDALVGRAAPAAVLVNPRDVAYGQFVPDATTRRWLQANAATLHEPQARAAAVAALHEAVREAELDPFVFADVLLNLIADERDADTHAWLLDLLGTAAHRWLDGGRADAVRVRATDLLLGQLHRQSGSGRELGTFRFLARHGSDPRVLDLCRAVCAGTGLPAGLTPGKQDCHLAAAALLAAGQARGELDALAERFRGEDVAKEAFLARAAAPDAAAKAAYWQRYLEPSAVPEQWIQDSLSWFHWPGQHALTLPYLQSALEQVEWVKASRRIFFMPAWLDAFVNGHSTPDALAVVDAFLAARQLPPDIRQKLLQSRDALARAVRIRAAY
jgi:aminopeptidase N